jgi:hypothetical protein
MATHPKTNSTIGVLLLGDFNQLSDKAMSKFPIESKVEEPTRGDAILGKIFTNIVD